MEKTNPAPSRQLGLVTATSLVVGNIIGCGVYMLPIALSKLGSIAIGGWVMAGGGALVIALIFARLSSLLPQQGGLFAYTRDGLGNYAAFQVAWHYWLLVWIGNASIVLGILSYLEPMVPLISTSPLFKFALCMMILWGITYINWRSVGLAGLVQLVTVVLKIGPILLLLLVGGFYIEPKNFEPMNLTAHGNLGAIGLATSMAMWAFIGVESASIPARYVKNPARNIPRATLLGVLIACVLYIAAAVIVIGVVPNSLLQHATAPYATAAQLIFSPLLRGPVQVFIIFGAVVSMLGALNGWVMLQAQMPYAAALSGLFPTPFKKLSSHETPTFGLVFSSLLITGLLAWSCFFKAEEALILFIKFASFAVMICYIFTVMSNLLLLKHHIKEYRLGFWDFLLTVGALVYLTWGLLSIDPRIQMIALPAFLLSTLLYVQVRYSARPRGQSEHRQDETP